MGYGFHPLGAWLANTAESLAMLLRPGNAGASHELIIHLLSLCTRRRTVLFTSGWAITQADEDAIRLLPAAAWQAAVDQDGVVQQDKHVAEITHLTSRAAGWPAGCGGSCAAPGPRGGRPGT